MLHQQSSGRVVSAPAIPDAVDSVSVDQPGERTLDQHEQRDSPHLLEGRLHIKLNNLAALL